MGRTIETERGRIHNVAAAEQTGRRGREEGTKEDFQEGEKIKKRKTKQEEEEGTEGGEEHQQGDGTSNNLCSLLHSGVSVHLEFLVEKSCSYLCF